MRTIFRRESFSEEDHLQKSLVSRQKRWSKEFIVYPLSGALRNVDSQLHTSECLKSENKLQ